MSDASSLIRERIVEAGPEFFGDGCRYCYIVSDDELSAASHEGHGPRCWPVEQIVDTKGIAGVVGRTLVWWVCETGCPLSNGVGI